MVSDVLLLSYSDKIGLSLMDEAGRASAYLYSEARIYSGRGKFMPLSPKSKILETNISWITEYFQRLSR